MNFSSMLRQAALAALSLASALPAFATGNCGNGQTLYSAPVAGLSCSSSSCHKANPASGTNKILSGANNPAKIASAINGGVPEMAIFKGKFTASDLDDLATWIALAPTCPAGGAPAISVAPATYTFPIAQSVGSTSAAISITVSNTGTAAASGVGIANSNAAEFPMSTTCGATLANGSSCTISAAFSPLAAGSRNATLSVNSSAGTNTVTLSGTGNVVAPGALAVPGSFAFGTQTTGAPSAPQAFTLTNTGGGAVTISAITSSNAAEFAVSGSTCGGSVAGGGSCSFKVIFTPSATGGRSASITITSTGVGSPQAIALSGTGTAVVTPGALSVPGPFSFGAQTIGAAGTPHAFTLGNTGGSAVAVSAVTSDNGAEFPISSSSCIGSVAPGASCSFSVTFAASATGPRTAAITILSNGIGSPQAIALTGTGTSVATPGALALPSAYTFADQSVGATSAAQSFNVTNTGGTAVAISSLGSSNPAEFTIGASSCSGSIAQGAGCNFAITFTPASAGARTALVTVVSDGVGSPQSFAVSGTGTTTMPPPPAAGTVDVVEFYYPTFDHYFVTASPMEINVLDTGVIPGWQRTGFQFKAYATDTPGKGNVCRFFSVSFAPKSSHFYTNLVTECGLVTADVNWVFEGKAFSIDPAAADGTCPAGAAPVYRLYNNGQGGAPNHRYVASPELRDQMAAVGWIAEGNLPGLAFMCSPQ